MSTLAEFQTRFAAALRHPGTTVAEAIGAGARARLDVYRNNVWAGLAEALAAAYPATRTLLGPEFFDAAAVDFARANPPSSPVLLLYGAGFPAFLMRYRALAQMPWVREVAELERAWLEVYHTADAAPLDVATLSGLDDAATARLRFAAHPAVRRLDPGHAILDLWRRHRATNSPGPMRLHRGDQHLMVLRPRLEVLVLELERSEAALVDALLAGRTLAEAVAAAAGAGMADLPSTLARLLACGCFASRQP